MAYRIDGMSPRDFTALIGADDATLAAMGARRIIADADHGAPCRISLTDARAGESLILTHHISHDVATPYRSGYAIYLREAATVAARYIDTLPPVFAGRALSLRGFDAAGMVVAALLAAPGEAEAGIATLFARAEIAYVLAFNAAYGCFAARVDRYVGDAA